MSRIKIRLRLAREWGVIIPLPKSALFLWLQASVRQGIPLPPGHLSQLPGGTARSVPGQHGNPKLPPLPLFWRRLQGRQRSLPAAGKFYRCWGPANGGLSVNSPPGSAVLNGVFAQQEHAVPVAVRGALAAEYAVPAVGRDALPEEEHGALVAVRGARLAAEHGGLPAVGYGGPVAGNTAPAAERDTLAPGQHAVHAAMLKSRARVILRSYNSAMPASSVQGWRARTGPVQHDERW